MPEGPEVSIVAKSLDSKYSGNTIHKIIIHNDSKYDIKDRRFKGAEGKKLSQVSFKGKKIIFELDGKGFLLSALGLEGKWLNTSSIPNARHLSITIEFIDGKVLSYYDTRHFGTLDYCSDRASLDSRLESVGIPWISSKMFKEIITKDQLFTFLSNPRLKKKTIMSFLMEQKYTSGVGNYIRAEGLYFAGISPHRLVNDISKQESNDLHDAIMSVMKESIKCGGHTLRTFAGTSGDPGCYVPEVYGRLSTLTKGEIIRREKDPQNRSIFWVPSVQV